MEKLKCIRSALKRLCSNNKFNNVVLQTSLYFLQKINDKIQNTEIRIDPDIWAECIIHVLYEISFFGKRTYLTRLYYKKKKQFKKAKYYLTEHLKHETNHHYYQLPSYYFKEEKQININVDDMYLFIGMKNNWQRLLLEIEKKKKNDLYELAEEQIVNYLLPLSIIQKDLLINKELLYLLINSIKNKNQLLIIMYLKELLNFSKFHSTGSVNSTSRIVNSYHF